MMDTSQAGGIALHYAGGIAHHNIDITLPSIVYVVTIALPNTVFVVTITLPIM